MEKKRVTKVYFVNFRTKRVELVICETVLVKTTAEPFRRPPALKLVGTKFAA